MFEIIEEWKNKFYKRLTDYKLNPKLIVADILYLCVTPIDAVLYLQWINSMTNYKFVAGGLIYPFFGLIFFAIPAVYKLWIGELDTKIPLNDLAKVGLMDSMGSIMAALTIPFIPIMLNVVTSKLVLPMTAVASYMFLGKRYNWKHIFGIMIVLLGVLSAAVPELEGDSTDNTNGIAMFFFVCSLIPGVASYIIKELYLKENPEADTWYMNVVISVYQVIVGIIALPLVMIPIPGLNIKPENFGSHLSNAFKCQLGGINSQEGDNCNYSFLYLMLFQLFGTIANILMFVIIREGSSVAFIMINTLKTPITAMLGFALIYYNIIKFTDEESFTFTWLNVLGMFFVLIGSIFYGLVKEKKIGDIDYDSIEIDDEESKYEREHKLLNPLLDNNNLLDKEMGNLLTHRNSEL